MTNKEAVKILKEIEYPANGDNWEYIETAFNMAIKALEQEPKTGHWLQTGDTDVYYDLPSYKCDKCGQDSLENGNFCPNCGARMEG